MRFALMRPRVAMSDRLRATHFRRPNSSWQAAAFAIRPSIRNQAACSTAAVIAGTMGTAACELRLKRLRRRPQEAPCVMRSVRGPRRWRVPSFPGFWFCAC